MLWTDFNNKQNNHKSSNKGQTTVEVVDRLDISQDMVARVDSIRNRAVTVKDKVQAIIRLQSARISKWVAANMGIHVPSLMVIMI